MRDASFCSHTMRNFSVRSESAQFRFGRYAMNRSEQVFNLERFFKKTVRAFRLASAACLVVRVRANDQHLRFRVATLYVIEHEQSSLWRIQCRGQMQIENRNLRLVNRRPANGGGQGSGRPNFTLVA